MRDFQEKSPRDPADVAKENEGIAVEEQRLVRLSINGFVLQDEFFVSAAPEIKELRLSKKEDAEMKQNLMAAINRIQGK